jgi:endogenous inhibitor of DNA gyrase (YacG/DUF329 family)
MSEQAVLCSECGETVVVVGYDGDGRPFVREQCPFCSAPCDAEDEQESYYSLAEPPR